MKVLATSLKPFGLALFGALFSATTVLFVFSAAPLFALRRSFGRSLYLLLGGAAFLGFVAAGTMEQWLPFLCVLVLVGVFIELENGHVKLLMSGFLSVLASLGVALTGLFFAAREQGLPALELVSAKVATLVEQLRAVNPEVQIEVSYLMGQVPSAVVMTALIALWIGLLLEDRFRFLFRAPVVRSEFGRRTFLQFTLPEPMVWIGMLSLLGAFTEYGQPEVQLIAANLLNIQIVLFFFQGLAIVATFFRSYKVGPFWQALVYIILVGQLFILLSALGFLDYWLELRRRISSNRPAPTT